jgi:hypothetical protein
MALRVRTVRDLDEQVAAISAIGHYFGWAPTLEDAERFRTLLPVDRMHAALDGGEIVAGAGAFPVALSARRSPPVRGRLRRRSPAVPPPPRPSPPDDARAAAGRARAGRAPRRPLGHGGDDLPPVRLRARRALPQHRRGASHRRHPARAAARRLGAAGDARRGVPHVPPPVRARRSHTPRDDRSLGRLVGDPRLDDWRSSAGALARSSTRCSNDGRAVGYAFYRLAQEGSTPETWTKTIRVCRDDAARTRDVWRFLLQIDWTDRVAAPICRSTTRPAARRPSPSCISRSGTAVAPRRRRSAALAGGRASATPTVEVASDPHFLENVGTWTVEGGDARVRRRPDVRVAVDALAPRSSAGSRSRSSARVGRAEGRPGGRTGRRGLPRVGGAAVRRDL